MSSKHQVVGSSPTGRAIFSPPNLKLLADYEPRVRWTHFIECHDMLAESVMKLLESKYHRCVVASDYVEDTTIILASILTNAFRNEGIYSLPKQAVHLANIIIALPFLETPGRVLKHRQSGTGMTQTQVDASIDNMITRMINLR